MCMWERKTDAVSEGKLWLFLSNLYVDSFCLVEPQLEMRSQDRQLAQTLLGLNSEIEKLRTETSAVTLDQDGSK